MRLPFVMVACLALVAAAHAADSGRMPAWDLSKWPPPPPDEITEEIPATTLDAIAKNVLASPTWDITNGPLPLLPDRAKEIATTNLTAITKRWSRDGEPVLFHTAFKIKLERFDRTHWFYVVTFYQQRPPDRSRPGRSTGGPPPIEVFVTFDGKVALVK